ncbi:MAG TPA: hypothetical protein VH700_14285 [Gemmatimonadales bacterium]|jgi:hypothetical protein
MGCRPGHHDWEVINAEQQGKEILLRRCARAGCGRWDEMRGVWTVISAPRPADELVVA